MSGVKQEKVDVNELVTGMYVSGLDRPWSQTPFPLQGFYVREPDEIEQLKLFCKWVFIDTQRGKKPLNKLETLKKGEEVEKSAPQGRQREEIKVAPMKIRHQQYAEVVPLRKEVARADKIHQGTNEVVTSFMTDLRDGKPLQFRSAELVANQLVDSALNNPDALSWLSRVKEKDEHTYSHIVRSAIWAMLFARHIGLDKKDMNILAAAVLLKDVGKVKLPQKILETDPEERTPEQEEEYRKFIVLGTETLEKTEGVSKQVINVIKHHCEMFNGSGYPDGLRGDRIPFLSKVIGIVTVYDTVTNPRHVRYPLAPSRAMARLYDMRNIEFQEELVVQFIQALGIYPTGTLVELSTGEVAVVVEQTFERRLKPKVMVVLDANKKKLETPFPFDLFEDYSEKLRKLDKTKKVKVNIQAVEIVKDLEPGSYEVDVASVRDSYLKENWNWRTMFGSMLGGDKKK